MHASEQAGSSSWTSAGKRKREVSDDGSGVSATQVAFALQKHRRVEVRTPFEVPSCSESHSRATVTSGPLSPQVSFHSTAGFLPMPSEPYRLSHDGYGTAAVPGRAQSFTSACSNVPQRPLWPPPGSVVQAQSLQRTTSAPDLRAWLPYGLLPSASQAMAGSHTQLSTEAGLLQPYGQAEGSYQNMES